MPVSEEPDLPRLCRLHEAGHAIVALEYGLTIKSVVCDGTGGHCQSELPVAAQEDSNYWGEIHHKAPCVDSFEHVVAVNFPWLASLLGGIAAENLMLGSPLSSLRRASDDLGSFYGFLSVLSPNLEVSQRDSLWLKTFIHAQKQAWRIVRASRSDVEKIADRLAKKPILSGDEIFELIR